MADLKSERQDNLDHHGYIYDQEVTVAGKGGKIGAVESVFEVISPKARASKEAAVLRSNKKMQAE